jgi:hypothetical protein
MPFGQTRVLKSYVGIAKARGKRPPTGRLSRAASRGRKHLFLVFVLWNFTTPASRRCNGPTKRAGNSCKALVTLPQGFRSPMHALKLSMEAWSFFGLGIPQACRR